MALRRWYNPSWNGDIRLEALAADPSRTLLVVEDPTPHEQDQLKVFLERCQSEGAISEIPQIPVAGRVEFDIGAKVSEAGLWLPGVEKPTRGTLTVIKSEKGTITATVDESQGPEVVAAAAADPKASDAVTVKKPTPCCPDPIEGALKRSSQVLREFCTPSQWKSWVENGWILCRGGITGYVYRLVHRHHPLAAQQSRICMDLTHGEVVHFYDWSVPPAEEVLAAKLILERREPWLRNPSTLVSGGVVFDNPWGLEASEGTWDSAFFDRFGGFVGNFTAGVHAAGVLGLTS